MGEHSRLMMQFASFLAQNNYPGLINPGNSPSLLGQSAVAPVVENALRHQVSQNDYQAAMIRELARQLLDKASALSCLPSSSNTINEGPTTSSSTSDESSNNRLSVLPNENPEPGGDALPTSDKSETVSIGPHHIDRSLLPPYALKLAKPTASRRKPGPKEKDSFGIYIFCLPDKHSKLPKFTSREPSERVLITKYQEQGCGYPPQDYFDTFSRKTTLCLNYTESKFLSFLVTSFPVLEDKPFDLYRIDKQRRLIRLQSYTPRHIKEMKYQGTVIIIPYNDECDRPPPIINRVGEEVVSSTFFTEFDSYIHSLDDTSSNDRESNERDVDPCSSPMGIDPLCVTLPAFPALSPNPRNENTHQPDLVESTNEGKFASHHSVKKRRSDKTTTSDNQQREPIEDELTFCPFTSYNLKQLILHQRQKNGELKKLLLKMETLVEDICKHFQDEPSLHHRVEFHLLSHGEDAKAVPTASVLVQFWRNVFDQDFHGRLYKIPKLNLAAASTTKFKVFGKILAHGLIYCNYWPLKLSPTCASFILCGQECSEDIILSSLEGFLPIYEWQILKNVSFDSSGDKKESIAANKTTAPTRSQGSMFSDDSNTSHKTKDIDTRMDVEKILHWYGCDLHSMSEDLGDFLLQLGRFLLICKPLWPLSEMVKGFESLLGHVCCTQCEVKDIYKTLELNPFQIFRKINYIFSGGKVQQEMEKVAKDTFERCLLRFSADELERFFFKWAGYDCLGIDCLYVEFSTNRDTLISFSNNNSSSLSILCLPVSDDRLFGAMQETI